MTDHATLLPPFHLAIPVNNIDAARDFYGEVLGFERGRSDVRWTDWNVEGHQVVTHQVDGHVNAVAGTNVIEPYVRFEGESGEQWTMFFLDPSGNALEFKAFKDMSQLFAV